MDTGSNRPVMKDRIVLLIENQLIIPSNDENNSLAWACYWVNQLTLFAPLLAQVKSQGDQSQWPVSAPTGPTLGDVAILVIPDQKQTCYSYEKHLIYVVPAVTGIETLHRVVFELCNAKRRAIYQKFEAQAKSGKIGCVAYACLKEALEVNTEEEHDSYLNMMLKEKEKLGRDEKKQYPIQTNLLLQQCFYSSTLETQGQRLQTQIQAGHTSIYLEEWLELYATGYFKEQLQGRSHIYHSWLDEDPNGVPKFPPTSTGYSTWLKEKILNFEMEEMAEILTMVGITITENEMTKVANLVANWPEFRKKVLWKTYPAQW